MEAQPRRRGVLAGLRACARVWLAGSMRTMWTVFSTTHMRMASSWGDHRPYRPYRPYPRGARGGSSRWPGLGESAMVAGPVGGRSVGRGGRRKRRRAGLWAPGGRPPPSTTGPPQPGRLHVSGPRTVNYIGSLDPPMPPFACPSIKENHAKPAISRTDTPRIAHRRTPDHPRIDGVAERGPSRFRDPTAPSNSLGCSNGMLRSCSTPSWSSILTDPSMPVPSS